MVKYLKTLAFVTSRRASFLRTSICLCMYVYTTHIYINRVPQKDGILLKVIFTNYHHLNFKICLIPTYEQIFTTLFRQSCRCPNDGQSVG